MSFPNVFRVLVGLLVCFQLVFAYHSKYESDLTVPTEYTSAPIEEQYYGSKELLVAASKVCSIWQGVHDCRKWILIFLKKCIL